MLYGYDWSYIAQNGTISLFKFICYVYQIKPVIILIISNRLRFSLSIIMRRAKRGIDLLSHR